MCEPTEAGFIDGIGEALGAIVSVTWPVTRFLFWPFVVLMDIAGLITYWQFTLIATVVAGTGAAGVWFLVRKIHREATVLVATPALQRHIALKQARKPRPALPRAMRRSIRRPARQPALPSAEPIEGIVVPGKGWN